ncbi:hypothetical protein ES332_D05G193800v1 [Gossypium tomentosum]|uniref:Uncharacterized protein n=1 Tax=Gossypium tomentosum TaxID=34277 RepID=A0A5D2KWM5_GOSTO|nr:hypothetical protein ES332_D05G193800v1 [Gossypium tomentosum]
MNGDDDGPPSGEFLRRRQSHIPLPCGAALLLLLLGIGHETYNSFFFPLILKVVCMFLRMWAMRKTISKHHLSGLNGF